MTNEAVSEGVAQKGYPSANEQMDIIREALDKLAEDEYDGDIYKTSPGNYTYKRYRLRFSVVYGEVTATLSKRSNGTVIDQYVGQHPIVWMLEGPLTPNYVKETLHAELDSRGYGTGV